MGTNYDRLSKEILQNIGGKENVNEMFHCVTRLRFYLKDSGLVDLDKIKQLKGVIGAQYATDQLQIIIGNDVSDAYKAMEKQIGEIHSSGNSGEKKNGFHLKGLFETLAAIFLPVVPVLAGTGMIKGLIIILTTYANVKADSGIMQLLTISSDCVFYFFPFLIAWSAAKRFKANIPLAMALAGCLLYPIMTEGLANGEPGLLVFGLTVPFVKYAGSSIPIILTVWVLSYVHPFINKVIPKALRLVFTPMLVMLVMTPLALILIAPSANYISIGLASVVKMLFEFSPIVAGLVVGATRPLVVLSGMHLSLGALIIENISQFGYDVILPINTMGTLAMAGAALGTWFKSKDSEIKTISFSAFISAFIGITEPVIYGVLLKFRNALIATMVGGGIAGAFVATFKGTSTAYVNSSILSLPVFMGPGFVFVCIGMAMAAAISFVLVQVLGLSEEKNNRQKKSSKQVDYGVYSPLSGKLVELKEIEDDVFSKGIMGKGIAIEPNSNQVVAPFDGEVVTIYPTKHAIGLTSTNGVELIIHIGLDTANLKGEYFDIKVVEGQKVHKGDVLAEVDFSKIKEQGFSIVTPIIISNTNQFLDVIPNKVQGLIKNSNKLLEIIQ
ncbi:MULTISPECIES: beta-glucoside-specific PTS transporter subunit IIABC [Enterococcus]|jgi:beta-glucoside PTS system EIICBA component|uniref:beta-glucoside-specific PTS transporter subunit IIABC n=1 Tax=Enterococcus TaxID=1350 RepID=UPI0010CA59FE|nr:beta-glucoside-specific PTS transporter subunit IIABC [Enterococcus avium]QCQ12309.1 PTS beta-glucoside transporter subunit EIIBCA [Enterococcus avium]